MPTANGLLGELSNEGLSCILVPSLKRLLKDGSYTAMFPHRFMHRTSNLELSFSFLENSSKPPCPSSMASI